MLCSAGEDSDVKIVAVDLQAMAPLPGVVQLQGDITKVRHSLTASFLSSFSFNKGSILIVRCLVLNVRVGINSQGDYLPL